MRTIDCTELAARFAELGYFFPVTVMSAKEAISYRTELESLEHRIQGSQLGNKTQLNYLHVIFRFADAIVRTPSILDAVETILGPDILVWGSTFFIKEPHSKGYVSWHQDLRYWGLDGDAVVSAWIALGPVNKANGCMRFVPESHKGGLADHKDTFTESNFLTRGQEAAVKIDESKVVHVELAPGQASFHHGRLLHASAPNRSDERRIGLVVNYIAPHVRQTVAKRDYAMLVRGEDRFGHFDHVVSPTSDMAAEAVALHRQILTAQNEAMYDGVQRDV